MTHALIAAWLREPGVLTFTGLSPLIRLTRRLRCGSRPRPHIQAGGKPRVQSLLGQPGFAKIKVPLLVPLVCDEQRPLDSPSGDVKLLGQISNDHEELVPVPKVEPDPRWFLGHRSDGMEQLPHTNVDNSVPARIEEHQNRRCHWHGDASESEEFVEPSPFAPRGKSTLRRASDHEWRITFDLLDGARRLPAADRL